MKCSLALSITVGRTRYCFTLGLSFESQDLLDYRSATLRFVPIELLLEFSMMTFILFQEGIYHLNRFYFRQTF